MNSYPNENVKARSILENSFLGLQLALIMRTTLFTSTPPHFLNSHVILTLVLSIFTFFVWLIYIALAVLELCRPG